MERAAKMSDAAPHTTEQFDMVRHRHTNVSAAAAREKSTKTQIQTGGSGLITKLVDDDA